MQANDEFDEFTFEISSSNANDEIIEEIESLDLIDENIEDKPKQKTIKILSERDIQYRDCPPPNYYSKFRSNFIRENSIIFCPLRRFIKLNYFFNMQRF